MSAISSAITRSFIGAGLKSIGMVARISDVPREQGPLRMRIAKREALVVGIIFVASLALEALSAAVSPVLRKSPVFQFIPQAVAYSFAEIASRLVFPMKNAFKNAMDAPSPQFVTGHGGRNKAFDFRTQGRELFNHISLPKSAPTDVYFQSAARLPDYWQVKGQPVSVRAFR